MVDAIGGRLRLPQTLAFLLFPMSLFLAQNFATAEPYIPQSEYQVLDSLPANFLSLFKEDDFSNRQIKRHTVSAEQWDELQNDLVTAYLDKAKVSGDMRYISYSENRLKSWLEVSPKSENARLLDASIKQYNHELSVAIQILESLLDEHPNNNKAWSLLSNLQLLTGNYSSAKNSCRQLSASSSLTDAIVCQSNIMIRTGDLDKADKALKTLLPMINTMPVQGQIWLYTSLVEINIQHGYDKQAKDYIDQALKLVADNNLNDNYLMRIHVDYLVDRSQLKQAFNLIKDKKNDSSIMIRSAIIAKKLGYTTIYEKNKITLTQMFEVENRRGQSLHLREQALFTLLILNKPEAAYAIAQKNWALQKEQEDARVLLKSVLSTGDKYQIHKVQAEINKTGLVDQRLEIQRLSESIL